MFAVSQDTLSPSHFVCFPPFPSSKVHILCTCCSLFGDGPSPAAGDRDIAGPQRCHPERILLLASAAKCTLHEWSNQAYVAREGMRSRMYSGFKWKPSPWLRKPCSFLHLWMLVLSGWMLGKILLNYTMGRSSTGLAGKKMRPMLLKSLCLPIKLKGFGP